MVITLQSIFQLLIEHGSSIDVKNEAGNSAIHCAALAGQVEKWENGLLQFLVQQHDSVQAVGVGRIAVASFKVERIHYSC